ncbi:hypothetical protein FIBSPDRAFT_921820 [Athelia psychrophila]|uniref:DUF3074 domain-containing protein n=1 Tax=Athelia psychrophila TaxID=1759441 RepID=A0A166BEG9_9AGAM|nr:hypothetical protein FIBSPDRAFT_921820 [Fibularhizoctonia sp. CBS 109695]
MSDFKLTIAPPLKPSEIPSEEAIVAAARAILDSTPTWKQGKSFHKKSVKTLSRAKVEGDGANWHVRVSEHGPEDATFDEFWGKLGNDKALNEKEYVPNIKKVTQIKQISPTQSIWTLYYTFPPPVSPRVFTVLQTTHLDENSPRTGLIVSIPINLADDPELAKLEEKGVKGLYTSVERLQEVEGGKTSWYMATSSTPGGSIPTFVAESSMAGQIAADVPHFLKWLHQVRSQPAAGDAASPEVQTPGDESLPTTAEVAHDETLNDALGAAGGGIGPTPSGTVLPL